MCIATIAEVKNCLKLLHCANRSVGEPVETKEKEWCLIRSHKAHMNIEFDSKERDSNIGKITIMLLIKQKTQDVF